MRLLLHKIFPVIVSLVLWFTSNAAAYTNGWYGWPCPTNADWNGACATNHYFFQLYTALVERCVAVNQTFSIVDAGVSLYNGYTNNVVTTNGVTVTNPVVQYKTVSLTNQFLPFTYTYDNGFASGVATCNPPMRYSWFTAWDSKLFAIAPYYVNTNRIGLYTNWHYWFRSPENISNTAASFPKFASTSLLDAAGVGWTNRTVAHWTISHSQLSSDWQLGQMYSSGPNGTSWVFKAGSDLAPWHPTANDSTRPTIQYVPGGTNETVNISISLSGTVWVSNGNTSVSASETALFLSTNNVVLTQAWRSVSSMVSTSFRANSNDAFRMQYSTLPDLYSSSAAMRLSGEALNERKACVDQLLHTAPNNDGATVWTNIRMGEASGNVYDGDTWGGLESIAETNWPNGTAGYTANNVMIGSWKYEAYRSGDWNVKISLVDWTITNGPPSNVTFAATCEYYIYPVYLKWLNVSYGTFEFSDIGGHGFLNNTYSLVGTSDEAIGWRSMTNSIEYDTVIPTWCQDPQLGNSRNDGSSLGYHLGPPKILYKWDGPNGFKYK